MIEIEEARHALSVAREHAEEGNYAACAAVVAQLIEMFPPHYRFGRQVTLATDAPDWVIDWDALDTEIISAINAQIVDEMRRRNKTAALNRAKARKPRASKFAWMNDIAAKVVAQKPNLSGNQLASLVLDAIQTESKGDAELPSERTVRVWIKKIRAG